MQIKNGLRCMANLHAKWLELKYVSVRIMYIQQQYTSIENMEMTFYKRTRSLHYRWQAYHCLHQSSVANVVSYTYIYIFFIIFAEKVEYWLKQFMALLQMASISLLIGIYQNHVWE